MADIIVPNNGTIHGTLPDNTDLNTVTDSGTYRVDGNNTHTNLPYGYTGGVLQVCTGGFGGSARTIQMLAGTGNDWIRYFNGSSWFAWSQIAGGSYSPTYANGILDYAVNVAQEGFSVVSPRNMGASDLPNDSFKYSYGLILKRGSSNPITVTLFPDSDLGYPVIMNRKASSSWLGWKNIAYSSLSSSTGATGESVSLSLSGISSNVGISARNGIASMMVSLGNGTAFSNATGNDSLGTIPTKFRPRKLYNFCIFGRDNGTWASANYIPLNFQMDTDGSIILRANASQIQSCKYISGAMVWEMSSTLL